MGGGAGVSGKTRWPSFTGRSLAGLAVTMAAVTVFSLYALRQIAGLKELQVGTVDRNRRDSLQLLRIQNDLHSLGLALRDMVSGDEPYPLQAWKPQLDRIRRDLDDALRLEGRLAPVFRTREQQEHLAASLVQFWTSVDEVLALASEKKVARARELIGTSLEAQQAALTTSVARLLQENNEAEQLVIARVQDIYDRVARNVYYFLAATLLGISLTSLYVLLSRRRLFSGLATLSEQRSALARRLITVQEEVLHSISRELHDEFGQILTAIGVMLGRAEKRGVPPGSPLCTELREVREIAQSTLEKMRSLSQSLHPPILDDGGLEKAIDWYLPVFEKQTGIRVQYRKEGASPPIPRRVAVNVYRVLQEALNNVARHSKSSLASVRARFLPGALDFEIEDCGVGIPAGRSEGGPSGIGMVAMRERAELLQGKIEFLKPAEGGTLVRLRVPLPASIPDEP